jgi:hypothetical protein
MGRRVGFYRRQVTPAVETLDESEPDRGSDYPHARPLSGAVAKNHSLMEFERSPEYLIDHCSLL